MSPTNTQRSLRAVTNPVNKPAFGPLDQAVLDAMATYASLLERLGLQVRVSTKASEERLVTLPSERKQGLIDLFTLNAQWLREEFAGQPRDKRILITAEVEKRIAKRALDHFGWKASDKFWDSLKEGDLVEIYNHEMIQLYRSLDFFRMCGYSILEVSTNEWYHLWARPTTVMMEMMKTAQRALDAFIEVASYEVPRHILRETQPPNPEENYQPRACLVEFKNIASLTKEGETAPVGGIVSSRGEVVAIGADAENIQFV